MNEQFLSRNQNEINAVFMAYRDLLSVRSHYVMYMDLESWELFDPNVGRTIIRHKFKHIKTLHEDLVKFRHDIINTGFMLQRTQSKPTHSETCSYKAMLKIYNEKELNQLYGKTN